MESLVLGLFNFFPLFFLNSFTSDKTYIRRVCFGAPGQQ